MAPTKTAPRGAAATPVTAVVPATLDNDELIKLLGETGMLSKSTGTGFHRMSLSSGVLVTDPGQPNEESWPPVKHGPTMTVQIVKPPVYYNAFFLSADEKNGAIDGARIGRPDLNGKFVKKYDDPAEQAADEWANVEAYEDLNRATNQRGAFRADIQLRIVPESGELTGEEPIYTLSLPGTSAIDWRGSSKNKTGGVVQEKNFIVQLGEFAQQKAIEAGATTPEELTRAVLEAMTALRLGGVVAEVYLIQTRSDRDPSITWTVVAFKPVYIETGENLAALTAGDETDDPSTNSDDLPF
jgi:hypothetical protein